LLILLQLVLGAAMRHQHAGLAVPDFPLAYGKIWPATDAHSVGLYNAHRLEAAGEQPITAAHIVVHMMHRFAALAVFIAIVGCTIVAWRNSDSGSLLRKISALWLGVVSLQIVLGILTIWSQRKVDVTTGHVAVGALTFAVGWLLVLISSRAAGAVSGAQTSANPTSQNALPTFGGNKLKNA
jgi:cytochrome c oxidase assembly protein subunit 15